MSSCCKLVLSRGSIYLVGPHVNYVALKWKEKLLPTLPKLFFDNRERRDGVEYHVTLVNGRNMDEISVKLGKSKSVLFEEIADAVKGLNLDSFVDVGVGKVSVDSEGFSSYFVVVSFEKLRIILSKYLAEDITESFHITLAFNPVDVHSIPKNLNSLMVDPINCNLLPDTQFMEELKCLTRNSRFLEALKLIECVKPSQKDVEIMEINALLLFKLARYEGCLEVSNEILELPQVNGKFHVLALIRQADAFIALRRYKLALIPIWKALSLSSSKPELVDLKMKTAGHLIGLLQKCARHGYLRIDVIPVSRKEFQDSERSVTIEDSDALEGFEIYQAFDKKEYKSILNLVTESYGEIECEFTFDEDFMPLESRWILSGDSKASVLPRNFSYLWPNRLAVSSTPRHAEDVKSLADLGISLVITLTEEEPLKSEWFQVEGVKDKCKNLFLPVPNYNPPSISVTDRIVWKVARHRSLIHCGGGKGRAGTAAAVVIMTLGMNPNDVRLCDYCRNQFRPFGTCPEEDCHFSKMPLHDPNMCLRIIRLLRPESLETVQQEAFLKTYSSALWQRCTVPKRNFFEEELNDDTLEIFGSFPSKLPRVIVLSGLPGSGKTTFSKKFADKLSEIEIEVDHINQDAIGGRDAFENALGTCAKALSRSNKSVLIVDRCNARRKDRKSVLDLLHNPHKEQVVFVHFATSEELCLQRIEQRFDHLTLKPEDGRRAVKHFGELMEMPDHLAEGAETLLVVKSIVDSEKAIELVLKCAPAPSSKPGNNFKAEKMEKFYKFPRTEHLFNLGGATRDDLVLTANEFKAFFAPAPGKVVSMEEKVDGANVGFSMDESGKILCQNRSHYVDSKYHFQFQSLGSFIFQKRESLERILKDGCILYGEWLYAKHSIHYSALPDIFIAFDIFFPKEQKFMDRAKFREIMSTTNIEYVRPLVSDAESYWTRESLETLLKGTKSDFSDSIIEGIYFRWDQNGKLKTRAKLVRSDFISGDEHWSKGKITLNTIQSLNLVNE